MAEASYSTSMDGGAAPSGQIATFTNIIGAAISVALLIGLIVWSVHLIIRDVSGIPVVQALDGPMRIAPEDPGGRAADYQGLAVNTIAANGVAAAPRPQARLAPTSTELAPEDQPLGTVVAANVIEPVVETPVQVAAAPSHPLAISSRPRARPVGLIRRERAAASAPEATIVPAVVKIDEVDPLSLVPGTRLAQIGAYDTPEIARAEWDRIAAKFGPSFVGRQRVIQKAQSGGRTFYRLRVAGFADVIQARTFCADLVEGRAECIPVLVR